MDKASTVFDKLVKPSMIDCNLSLADYRIIQGAVMQALYAMQNVVEVEIAEAAETEKSESEKTKRSPAILMSPFFDQEEPIAPIVGMIASIDMSQPYELDATAVYKCERGFLVVSVSGCSCWPDRGSTTQEFCSTLSDVDKTLMFNCRELLTMCQQRNWNVTEQSS